MATQLFEEEVRKWDAELKGKKILLLVDNCSVHPQIHNLQNIELAFFTVNTTHSFHHDGLQMDEVEWPGEDDLLLSSSPHGSP